MHQYSNWDHSTFRIAIDYMEFCATSLALAANVYHVNVIMQNFCHIGAGPIPRSTFRKVVFHVKVIKQRYDRVIAHKHYHQSPPPSSSYGKIDLCLEFCFSFTKTGFQWSSSRNTFLRYRSHAGIGFSFVSIGIYWPSQDSWFIWYGHVLGPNVMVPLLLSYPNLRIPHTWTAHSQSLTYKYNQARPQFVGEYRFLEKGPFCRTSLYAKNMRLCQM